MNNESAYKKLLTNDIRSQITAYNEIVEDSIQNCRFEPTAKPIAIFESTDTHGHFNIYHTANAIIFMTTAKNVAIENFTWTNDRIAAYQIENAEHKLRLPENSKVLSKVENTTNQLLSNTFIVAYILSKPKRKIAKNK